jgi:hypothetical protein
LHRHALWLAFALSLASANSGCEGKPEDDRHARRFMPYQAEWQHESDIPSKYKKKLPAMVIWELSRYAPGTEPTPEQQLASEDLIERAHAAAIANHWNVFKKAKADGFHLLPDDGIHFMKDEYLTDDRILDPEHPEFLMYYLTPKGFLLVGMMFYTRSMEERGPQIGGPLTVWHYHRWRYPRCFRDAVVGVQWLRPNEKCKEGTIGYRSPEMMHVWLVDHPSGPFATGMQIADKLLPGLFKRRIEERGY